MTKEMTIKKYISDDSVKNRIEELLKDRAPQFIMSITSLASNDVKLAECEPKSIVTAALTAAAMNLPINNNLGYVYLIPYRDSKSGITHAQLQFGYKAFVQLSMRSGQFKTINVTDVKEGEMKGINRLSGEMDFEWLPEKERAKAITVGYVAYIKLTNGFEKSFYMTVEELKAHGVKFSKTAKKGFGLWVDEFDAMAKKTVLKLLLSKYAPMTTDMAKAQESDQAILTDKGYEYIDNKPVVPEEEAAEKERQRILNHIKKAKTIAELQVCNEAIVGDTELEKEYDSKWKELEK